MDCYTANKRWFHVEIYGTQSWGFSAEDGVIKDVPPIFQWAKGKALKQVKHYFLKNRANVIEIKPKYNEQIIETE